MGYRTYISSMSRKEWNKIKKLTKEELYQYKNIDIEDDYIGPYDFGTELYEFGKYTEFDDKKFYKPVFTNKETQNYFLADHDFYIVKKEFLEHIIEHYTKKIKNYYTELLSPFFNEKGDAHNPIMINKDGFKSLTENDIVAISTIIRHLQHMAIEWGVSSWFTDTKPYNLIEGEKVTNSWTYEYSLFELVRIYKTFDWKKNVMIYYGY